MTGRSPWARRDRVRRTTGAPRRGYESRLSTTLWNLGEDRLGDPWPLRLRLEGASLEPEVIWGRGPVLHGVRGSTWFVAQLMDITAEGWPLDVGDVTATWQNHVAHRHIWYRSFRAKLAIPGALGAPRGPRACSSADRASASGAEGRRFESCRARQFNLFGQRTAWVGLPRDPVGHPGLTSAHTRMHALCVGRPRTSRAATGCLSPSSHRSQ